MHETERDASRAANLERPEAADSEERYHHVEDRLEAWLPEDEESDDERLVIRWAPIVIPLTGLALALGACLIVTEVLAKSF